MAYEYDVFISYSRKDPYCKWVNDIFLPFFRTYFEEEVNLQRKAEIFVDLNEISSGQAWDSRIKNALIHSRIMVSVLSPAYFNSQWCKKEFAVLDYRQIECGYMSVANPNGIIVPISVFDGEHFPEYVNGRVQITNFNTYMRLGIESSQLYVPFQDELIKWVKQVANAYRNAPDWDNKWRDPEWIEKSFENMERLDSIKSNKPPTL